MAAATTTATSELQLQFDCKCETNSEQNNNIFAIQRKRQRCFIVMPDKRCKCRWRRRESEKQNSIREIILHIFIFHVRMKNCVFFFRFGRRRHICRCGGELRIESFHCVCVCWKKLWGIQTAYRSQRSSKRFQCVTSEWLMKIDARTIINTWSRKKKQPNKRKTMPPFSLLLLLLSSFFSLHFSDEKKGKNNNRKVSLIHLLMCLYCLHSILFVVLFVYICLCGEWTEKFA